MRSFLIEILVVDWLYFLQPQKSSREISIKRFVTKKFISGNRYIITTKYLVAEKHGCNVISSVTKLVFRLPFVTKFLLRWGVGVPRTSWWGEEGGHHDVAGGGGCRTSRLGEEVGHHDLFREWPAFCIFSVGGRGVTISVKGKGGTVISARGGGWALESWLLEEGTPWSQLEEEMVSCSRQCSRPTCMSAGTEKLWLLSWVRGVDGRVFYWIGFFSPSKFRISGFLVLFFLKNFLVVLRSNF